MVSDAQVEAAARWLSQNVVSGTQNRDPDSEPWGTSGMKAWQAWEKTARGVLSAAGLLASPERVAALERVAEAQAAQIAALGKHGFGSQESVAACGQTWRALDALAALDAAEAGTGGGDAG